VFVHAFVCVCEWMVVSTSRYAGVFYRSLFIFKGLFHRTLVICKGLFHRSVCIFKGLFHRSLSIRRGLFSRFRIVLKSPLCRSSLSSSQVHFQI